jgi:hypothetical protein
MTARDLPQALAVASIAEDGIAIEFERLPSDVPALELGSPHAGSHTLDDQVAFEFRDRSDDDDDGPAQRAGRVDRLAEADELDVEAVELIEHFEQMSGRARDPIASPDQDDIEPAAAGIPHQISEPWPARLHAADLVHIFLDDLIAALSSHLAQIVELRLGVLIDRTHLIYRTARFILSFRLTHLLPRSESFDCAWPRLPRGSRLPGLLTHKCVEGDLVVRNIDARKTSGETACDRNWSEGSEKRVAGWRAFRFKTMSEQKTCAVRPSKASRSF